MKAVLFICVHNSGRSQMAEAFFNRLAKGKAVAISAGTEPAAGTDRGVVAAMGEIGIDISRQMPKPLTPEMIQQADRVISMGCGVAESCPAGFVTTDDWELDDPAGKSPAEVRQIRDEVKARAEALVKEI